MTAAEMGRVLFVADQHRCCDCCDDYCPYDEIEPPEVTWFTAVACTVDGVDYEGLACLLVRSDVAALPEGAQPMRPTFSAPVPATRPPVNDRPMVPQTLDRIDRAGFTVHDDGSTPLHLYRGDEHVGWTMPSAERDVRVPGIAVADLPLVRAVATTIGVDANMAMAAIKALRDAEAAQAVTP